MGQRVSVIGAGYLGATHAVCMSELGYDVVGIDVDGARVAALAAGEPPFYEPGLAELLRKHVEAGRLAFTTSFAAAAGADVHFICVGTPQQPGGPTADLSHVDDAITALTPHLTESALVVGKSTVPVGTAARLAERLPPCAELAWNPEFLREGFAVEDTLRPDRLVFGVRTASAERRLRAVFAPLIEAGVPVIVTDYATAEMVKVAANSFLATKISFINAVAEVCEAAGADVGALAEALGRDRRIGDGALRPGLGFGGGCLPKDIRAFVARANELGAGRALAFLDEVDAINLRRRDRALEVAGRLLGSFDGATIAGLGAAFKPNSDDIRDSPALAVAAELRRRGARVVVYDPAAVDNARREHPELEYAHSTLQAATGADLVAVLTEWNEFRDIDPGALGAVVARRTILDARGALDPAAWRAGGWTYQALGHPVR